MSETCKRARVLFVSDTPLYGGAEKHLTDLVQQLNQDRFRAEILCVGSDVFSERLPAHAAGGLIHTAPRPASTLAWRALLRKLRPETAVFVHGLPNTFRLGAYLGARLAGVDRVCSVQHLASAPDSLTGEGPPPLRLARYLAGWRRRELSSLRLAARLCRGSICVSEEVRSVLLRHYGYSPHKVTVVHNGVDPALFYRSPEARAAMRQRLQILPEELVFVCVGRLCEMKGYDVLLPALARLATRERSWKCIIAGDGPLRAEMEASIVKLGLQGRVLLEGFQKDIRPYLQAADIFALSSYREGLPLALLESMATSLPCVVTRVGGNAEVVQDGIQGFLVQPGDPVVFADRLMRLTGDRSLRERMASAARKRIEEAFSLSRQIRQIESVLTA